MTAMLQADITKVGREIFDLMKGQKPSVFNKDWWSGKVMDWSMKDDAFKIEMFRFVDVFPSLNSHVHVAEHLQEYFCRPETDFPAAFKWGLDKVKPDSMVAKLAAGQIEKQMVGMAQKFIAGETAKDAVKGLGKLWKSNLAFTLDLLGEATVSENEALDYYNRYLEIIETLAAETTKWKSKPQLETASWGEVPRANVSIKVSSLYSQIDPVDFDGSISAVADRLRPLLRRAKQDNVFVNLDMEHHAYKDLTIELFKRLLMEPEFVDYPHVGIAIQAYLRDAPDDLEKLCAWATQRGTPVTVRIIKGAYWDYETIHSDQEGWVNPVWGKKWETDLCFEQCTRILLDHHEVIRTAIGSHNVRSIAHAIVYAREKGLPDNTMEFQMLYGMAEPMKGAMAKAGFRVREYVPIGEMIPGMAYLVRRLLENTSNESWLRQSYAEGASIDELLAAPGPQDNESTTGGTEHLKPVTADGFRNHPMLNFAHQSDRAVFQSGLDGLKLGDIYPAVINGASVAGPNAIVSLDPSDGTTLGTAAGCSVEQAQTAIDAAKAAYPAWRDTPVSERTKIVRRAADIMAEERATLGGWIVREVGKGWVEADADVCEAIDFCRYYADEMERLAKPQRMGVIGGELNVMFYQSRGVCGVIAPWNFPLAILAGMAVGALVTGNTVVMKPAEQSSIVGAKLMDIFVRAGVPNGVINFVPGDGETVGKLLVDSPDVQTIAFTGSMQVGLEILRKAGDTTAAQTHVKQVVCEMGGKNAIIVDIDADLDEAVQGVLKSAFAFQGQKCSACSRAIVLDACYDTFVARLLEATKSLTIGPASDPANFVGPVVDAQAKAKIESYIRIGAEEGTILVQRDAPTTGTFVGPTIISDIKPTDRLAQEEIFGPVLALIRAQTFDEALDIANGTRFALTGAVFSRSPVNIQKTYQRFRVGNLYINRGSTGALVARQPFGGFKMSGTGTKAGGPDYLINFMDPRTVTENTMRRGFAPDV